MKTVNKKKFKYDKTIEGYFFLKKLQIYSKSDLYKDACLDFSYFKFGVKKYFNLYTKLLIKMIKKEIGKDLYSGNWVLASRANFVHDQIFGSISDAMVKTVAKQINLKYVISYPSLDLEKDVNYSKLKSKNDRANEINKRKYLLHFSEDLDLKNKNIIFIDDIINSGLTIKTIQESFKKHGVKKFKVFAVAKLLTSNLGYEYELSRAILLPEIKNKNIEYLKRLFATSKLIVTHKFLKIIKKDIKF